MSEERTNALPCIRCGKQLLNIMSKRDQDPHYNQPYSGTAFTTSGHYGSTVFDEMHGGTIEINVCDTCLLDAAAEQRVLYYVRVRRVDEWEKGPWEPDVDEDRVRDIDRKQHGL